MSKPKARIEVRLRELAQLFNSMDPSPFVDRDLDGAAEEFITSWARQHASEQDFELVIHLAAAPSSEAAAGLETAVRHYFDARAQTKAREFRQLLRRGRVSLVIGLLFMAACLVLAELSVHLWSGTMAGIIREGLTIVGWVAMWRPLEIYLYDWWPLKKEERLLARLARMHVRMVTPT